MKGFTLTLSVVSLIATILIGVFISFVLGIMYSFHLYITKTLIIEKIYSYSNAQDALLSLLEMKKEGISFKQALIYSMYENTLEPKIYNGEKEIVYSLKDVAKEFLDYFYIYDDYWLFLYNTSTQKYETILASKNNPEKLFSDPKGSSRAQVPLSKDYYIVIYIKTTD